MLLPMLLGALAQGGGWLMLELPEWLLAMAYAVLGWTVGLQFNKAIFLLALKTLPQIIASIIGLILMCALMALALTHILQMDFMTAYLATSPGGLDTVAIIAAGTRADMSFIMALQTLRLFTILLTGPAMARAISLCAAAIKSPRRARAGQIECPRARCARAICYQAFRAASAAS